MRRISFPEEQRKILKVVGEIGEKLGYSIYLVGGPVRDLLLGRTSRDVDVVCVGDAVKIAKRFCKKVGGELKIQRDFPNATVKWNGGKIDFVTARSERYSKRKVALPKIEKTNDIIVDLKRRDFTINTIACNLLPEHFGDIIDPFDGLKDCNKKLIRILHPDSFKEDPTRILRAIRFIEQLGFGLERNTKKYIKRDLKYLKKLTTERIWKEIKLCIKSSSSVFKFLKVFGVLKILDLNYPTEDFIERVDLGAVHFGVDPLFTFIFALTEGKTSKIREFDRKFARQVECINRFKKARLHDISIVHELLLLEDFSLVYLFAKYPESSIIIENFFDNRDNLMCEMNGEEFKEIGVKEGPEIGKLKKRIMEERWTGRISNKEDEIEFVKRYVKGDNET
ncbi:CCA tRNA nucleotidyltransferase [candidate division WOR-3 bacterium]|nr:CCA tRNA nucleotidyltransferase [candidate division WOR-3 bacterium]